MQEQKKRKKEEEKKSWSNLVWKHKGCRKKSNENKKVTDEKK